MVILEHGAQKCKKKRSMEQRKILKRSTEQENHPEARRKMKKEQGTGKNQKGARKSLKRNKGQKLERSSPSGPKGLELKGLNF